MLPESIKERFSPIDTPDLHSRSSHVDRKKLVEKVALLKIGEQKHIQETISIFESTGVMAEVTNVADALKKQGDTSVSVQVGYPLENDGRGNVKAFYDKPSLLLLSDAIIMHANPIVEAGSVDVNSHVWGSRQMRISPNAVIEYDPHANNPEYWKAVRQREQELKKQKNVGTLRIGEEDLSKRARYETQQQYKPAGWTVYDEEKLKTDLEGNESLEDVLIQLLNASAYRGDPRQGIDRKSLVKKNEQVDFYGIEIPLI